MENTMNDTSRDNGRDMEQGSAVEAEADRDIAPEKGESHGRSEEHHAKLHVFQGNRVAVAAESTVESLKKEKQATYGTSEEYHAKLHVFQGDTAAPTQGSNTEVQTAHNSDPTPAMADDGGDFQISSQEQQKIQNPQYVPLTSLIHSSGIRPQTLPGAVAVNPHRAHMDW
jgi:hypothetical protein